MRLRPAFRTLALAVTFGACAASDTGDTGDGDASVEHDAAPPDSEPVDDADGDGIPDAVEDAPDFDRDGDGTPDYLDTDSDDDGVRDYYEGASDYDSDGAPNFRDEDADGDCVPDALEGGDPPRDFDGDTRWDFLDRDSDDDGLPDGAEDADCDGVVDDGETSATDADSDDDGVTDLVEDTAGTDPNNPEDNPQAEGDFVFIEPYQAPQTPASDDLDFATDLIKVDVYLLIDRSNSMTAEIADIRDTLATALDTVQCPPQGNGDLDSCVPDLWGGAGTIGYASNEPYFHRVDMQPDPLFSAIPATTLSTTPSLDATTFAMWSALTGNGSASAPQCTLATVAPAPSCASSPAADAGYGTFGYPCFREGAMPVVVVATDEAPRTGSDTLECPAWANTTRNAFDDRSAKLMGVIGANPNATTREDLEKMAEYTGAVDTNNDDAPLVFDGADANAAEAVADGLATLAAGVPLDLSALAFDDTTADTVDAVGSFIDHLETLQAGPRCTPGLDDIDTNADTYDDYYVDVRTGTPVCWRVVSKPNTTVPATSAPQLFHATVDVYGDGVTMLDRRDVYFLVPPAPFDPPVD